MLLSHTQRTTTCVKTPDVFFERKNTKKPDNLDAETTRLPLATRLLELAALVLVVDAHVGLLAGPGCARGLAEVLVHLARLERAAEEHAVGAGGCAQSQLVERDEFTTRGRDARARVVRGAQAADGQLERRVVEHAHVVGHRAHHHCDLPLLPLHLLGDLGDRHGRAVGPRHEQAFQHNGIELGISPARQETVQLHEKLDVHVLGLGGLPEAGLGLPRRLDALVETLPTQTTRQSLLHQAHTSTLSTKRLFNPLPA